MQCIWKRQWVLKNKMMLINKLKKIKLDLKINLFSIKKVPIFKEIQIDLKFMLEKDFKEYIKVGNSF